ncbi:hypothetical protein ElyMa_005396500 [Elysia marginata]|uniref:Uncharacterized protein n=1 Tax=Elysia marginata TaxID=1093978 RepID=A0AAV4EGX5_9GAST|nr:hypothetical protein ElyMa_005396500 [Elysia marginata]
MIEVPYLFTFQEVALNCHEKLLVDLIKVSSLEVICDILWGSVAEWLARRTRDLEITASTPDHAMLQLPWESNFPSPPTFKMGTQRQASNVLVCWGISGAALWRHSYAE